MKTKFSYPDLIILLLCMAAGTLLMFVNVNIGGGLGGDEAYQTLCVRRYQEAPLGLLVYWIGHWWTSWFGFSFLNLRYLTSIEITLSVLVASCFCFLRTRSLRLSSLMFLLGCVIAKIGSPQLYNWDTGIFLFDAIGLCLAVSILKKPSVCKCIGLGLSIACMGLGRTPTFVFLPLSMLLIGLNSKNKNTIIFESSIFFSCVVSVLILTWIILGHPTKYIDLFLQGNVVSGHSPVRDFSYLMYRMYWMIKETPSVWCFGIISLLLPVILIKIKNRTYQILILIPWVAFAVLSSYWLTSTHLSSFLLLGMGSPLVIGFLLAFPIYSIFNKNRKLSRLQNLSLWMCAAFLFSAVLGTDTFTERLSLPFVVPVCVAILWYIHYNTFHSYLKYAIAVSLITFGSMLLMHLGKQAYIFKDDEPITLAPFNGIKSGEMYSEIEFSLNAIQYLHDNNIQFLSLNDNKLAELVTGTPSIVPLHEFHTFLFRKDYWLENKDRFLPYVDAVVYVPRFITPENDYEFIIEDIREEGFNRQVSIDEAVILFKN